MLQPGACTLPLFPDPQVLATSASQEADELVTTLTKVREPTLFGACTRISSSAPAHPLRSQRSGGARGGAAAWRRSDERPAAPRRTIVKVAADLRAAHLKSKGLIATTREPVSPPPTASAATAATTATSASPSPAAAGATATSLTGAPDVGASPTTVKPDAASPSPAAAAHHHQQASTPASGHDPHSQHAAAGGVAATATGGAAAAAPPPAAGGANGTDGGKATVASALSKEKLKAIQEAVEKLDQATGGLAGKAAGGSAQQAQSAGAAAANATAAGDGAAAAGDAAAVAAAAGRFGGVGKHQPPQQQQQQRVDAAATSPAAAAAGGAATAASSPSAVAAAGAAGAVNAAAATAAATPSADGGSGSAKSAGEVLKGVVKVVADAQQRAEAHLEQTLNSSRAGVAGKLQSLVDKGLSAATAPSPASSAGGGAKGGAAEGVVRLAAGGVPEEEDAEDDEEEARAAGEGAGGGVGGEEQPDPERVAGPVVRVSPSGRLVQVRSLSVRLGPCALGRNARHGPVVGDCFPSWDERGAREWVIALRR